MDSLFSQISELMNYAVSWLNEYVFSSLLNFIKAFGELIIKILEFCVWIIKWMISYI